MKAAVGAHEVISTIMLNWIAIYGAQYLFELNGPLQGPLPDVPQSSEVTDSAKLPAVWGVLQPLHAGIFLALAALVVYHVLINRTMFGYEVRAVGHNAEAARYGGIPVARSYMATLAIGGAFAGMAGACDVLGWEFHIVTNDIAVSQIGFIGIAVALLGRNEAIGIAFAALLFGGLQVGTSSRALDPTVFPPQLAGNLSVIIQGLIILFVGAQLLLVYAWRARRRPGRAAAGSRGGADGRMTALDRIPRGARGVAILGIVVGLVGLELALPPLQVEAAAVPGRARAGRARLRDCALSRDERQIGAWDALRRGRRDRVRDLGAGKERHVDRARRQLRPLRRDPRLRDPARLRRDRRHLLRALRRRQHRARRA